MGRPKGKVVVKFIEDKKSRKSTFATRTKGFTKKFHEFTTLCGVEACFVAFGRDGERKYWPEDEEQVRGTIDRYNQTDEKKRVDPSSFEKKALEKQLGEIRKENLKMLYPNWDARFDELSREGLAYFGMFVEGKLKRVTERKMELMIQNRLVDGFLGQQVSFGDGFDDHTSMMLKSDSDYLNMHGNWNGNVFCQPPPMVEGLPELPESLPPLGFQQMPGQFFDGGENSMGSIYDNGPVSNSNDLNGLMIHQQLPLNALPMSPDFMPLFQPQPQSF